MRELVGLGLLALAAAASAQTIVPGLVSVGSNGVVHLRMAEVPPDTQPIFFQTLDARGRLRCCVRVSRGELVEDGQGVVRSDVSNVVGTKIASYTLAHKLPGFVGDGFDGIAISARGVAAEGAHALKAFGENQRVARVRLCFGSEGIILIARSGGKKNSKVQALYRAFGYEVDEKPKCGAADLRDLENASD